MPSSFGNSCIIFILLESRSSKIPRNIIPKQIKHIEKKIKLLIITPKKRTEMPVVTKGPNPLAIGYTLVRSPI